ncbi:hypothetical protein ACFQ0I_13075 [Mariniflexile aquimaris]|uniref:Competence protein CoiA-like protein n=1 Tax=Mariniflexile aquimaris TaxID=881009 RepID=A0ABW3BU61_9FLAO
MSAKITLGEKIGTKKIVHISNVKNGLKCKCLCTECGEKLIAINNKNNKREIHFRHEVDSECKGGIETALHLLAKQIVTENNSIKLFENTFFNYSKSELEVLLFDYTPDVIIENPQTNEKWLIEIAVTSFIAEEKLKKIQRDKLNCLEIDLKRIDRKITPSELKPILLNDNSIRKIINRQAEETIEIVKLEEERISKEETKSKKDYSSYNWLLVITLLLIGYFGFKALRKRKNL